MLVEIKLWFIDATNWLFTDRKVLPSNCAVCHRWLASRLFYIGSDRVCKSCFVDSFDVQLVEKKK